MKHNAKGEYKVAAVLWLSSLFKTFLSGRFRWKVDWGLLTVGSDAGLDCREARTRSAFRTQECRKVSKLGRELLNKLTVEFQSHRCSGRRAKHLFRPVRDPAMEP